MGALGQTGGKSCRGCRRFLPGRAAPALIALALIALTTAGAFWAGTAEAADAADAPDRQSLAALTALAREFAERQAAGADGEVEVTARPPDARLRLPVCPVPQAFLPPGRKPWGSTLIGVRCDAPVWTVYLPVDVAVWGVVVVSSRPLARGQVITAADVAEQRTDITRLPVPAARRLQDVLGKTLRQPLATGRPLAATALQAPVVVTRGQVVALRSAGPGFSVFARGQALASAGVGDLVNVKTANGRVVSGVVTADGAVEIGP